MVIILFYNIILLQASVCDAGCIVDIIFVDIVNIVDKYGKETILRKKISTSDCV